MIVVVVASEFTVTAWVVPLAALYVADCAVCAVSEQVPAPINETTRPEAVHTFDGLAETLRAPSPVAWVIVAVKESFTVAEAGRFEIDGVEGSARNVVNDDDVE